MNDALHKVKRELREIGSNANTRICFEVRAPCSTSPPTPPCRISNPLGVPNSTLNLTKPPRLYNHNPPLRKRDKARSQQPTQSPLPKRDPNQYHSDQPLPKRDTTKSKGVYNLEATTTSNNLFSTNNDPK